MIYGQINVCLKSSYAILFLLYNPIYSYVCVLIENSRDLFTFLWNSEIVCFQ